MSEISDLSKDELQTLARAVELWEELMTVLSGVEAYPQDHTLHIHTEIQPGYLGYIGWTESGIVAFQPAALPNRIEEPDFNAQP